MPVRHWAPFLRVAHRARSWHRAFPDTARTAPDGFRHVGLRAAVAPRPVAHRLRQSPGWPADRCPAAPTPTSPDLEIGRAHVRTSVTNAQLVCRLMLDKKQNT